MPPDENRLRTDHAPTPFSAEEIRAACPPGRVNLFKLESAGDPEVHRETRFLGRNAETAEFESRLLDAEGGVLEEGRAQVSWTDLQAHASFPAAETVVEAATVRVPAGSFECWLYTVTDEEEGRPRRTRLWFARDLPGPPVLLERDLDGRRVFTMTLLSCDRPGSGRCGTR